MGEWLQVQARHYRPGRIKPVELIVIHSMEAPERVDTAENIAHYFATTDVEASAHFCVDNNSVVQCVKLADTAYAARNANANGVHIEHAGYAKQTREEWLDEYGKAMLGQSAALAAIICKQFNIPVQKAKFAGVDNPRVTMMGFVGHAEVPLHGSHWDPGSGFPWDYYLAAVRTELEELQ